jgi:hypothetical protein
MITNFIPRMYTITFFLDKVPKRVTKKMRESPRYVHAYPEHRDRVWMMAVEARSADEAMDEFVDHLNNLDVFAYIKYVRIILNFHFHTTTHLFQAFLLLPQENQAISSKAILT